MTKTSLQIVAFTAAMLGTIALAAPVTENWENHCTKCHGADGRGQTKAGKKLKVRDYTSAAVQAEMTDEEMYKAIVEGTVDKNGKETMKGYKDELTPEEMAELVTFIRSLKR
jgi:cytochrome c6